MTREQELILIDRAVIEGKLRRITPEEARASLDQPLKLRSVIYNQPMRKNKSAAETSIAI